MVWEHDVLAALSHLPLPPPPFHIPTPIPPLHPAQPSPATPVASFVQLSDGACACLFKKIPGCLPKLSHVTSIGAAAGDVWRNAMQLRLRLLICRVVNAGRDVI